VRLPLDASATIEPARASVQPSSTRRRVLIIEDNVDAADTLHDLLSLRDHEVAVAYNGPDGVSKAGQFVPDVVLCDIGLPGMDGYDVARALRAEAALKQTALVALSGYALPEDMQRAVQAGFHLHLRKPPKLDEIEGVLANLPVRRAGDAQDVRRNASHGGGASAEDMGE
jgi:two-component system CheB/CheR fusion protein